MMLMFYLVPAELRKLKEYHQRLFTSWPRSQVSHKVMVTVRPSCETLIYQNTHTHKNPQSNQLDQFLKNKRPRVKAAVRILRFSWTFLCRTIMDVKNLSEVWLWLRRLIQVHHVWKNNKYIDKFCKNIEWINSLTRGKWSTETERAL